LDEARKIYHRAAAAHPQNAKVLNDLALCYARSGQLLASLQLMERAVQLQPDKALYRNNIAKLLTEMDRVDEAIAHLSAVHPPAIAQYNMGVLLEQRGRTAEAIHFLTAASHINPQLQSASKMLTNLQGDLPRSMANDGVLPTPITPEMAATGLAVGPRYAPPFATSNRSLPQSFPAEIAQVPLGNSPVALPPVR
jgi:tetratricopeptide (TPR) repeat protein